MNPERRYCGVELRAEGRRLIGPAIRYGDTSPTHRERFAPGAFTIDDRTRWLDLRHDRTRVVAWTGGGGLELIDGHEALELRATLPEIPAADIALADIKAGRLTGLSIEFDALEEHRENGIRIVTGADLSGIGIVAAPSYEQSQVEIRARSGRTIRQTIPAARALGCECSGTAVAFAEFELPALREAFGTAWDEAAEILAVRASYGTPLAAKSRGTVRANMDGDAAVVEIDLPTGPDGDAVLRDQENVGVLIRPYLDSAESEGDIKTQRAEAGGNVMVYKKMRVRALVVGATDARAGWPEPELIATPGMRSADRIIKPRRRAWL